MVDLISINRYSVKQVRESIGRYQFTIIEKVRVGQYSSVIRFVNRNSANEVLHHIGIAANRNVLDDEATIERIIRMDEYGHTGEMQVVFKDGRLQLELIPRTEGR